MHTDHSTNLQRDARRLWNLLSSAGRIGLALHIVSSHEASFPLLSLHVLRLRRVGPAVATHYLARYMNKKRHRCAEKIIPINSSNDGDSNETIVCKIGGSCGVVVIVWLPWRTFVPAKVGRLFQMWPESQGGRGKTRKPD